MCETFVSGPVSNFKKFNLSCSSWKELIFDRVTQHLQTSLFNTKVFCRVVFTPNDVTLIGHLVWLGSRHSACASLFSHCTKSFGSSSTVGGAAWRNCRNGEREPLLSCRLMLHALLFRLIGYVHTQCRALKSTSCFWFTRSGTRPTFLRTFCFFT